MKSNAERYKEWAEKNKDHLREYRKKYYEAHREEMIQRVNEWVAQNRDRVRQNKQRYADAHKEYNRERAKKYRAVSDVPKQSTAKWRANNPDHKANLNRLWKQENKHRVRESRAERRAREISATPAWADRSAMAAIYAGCGPGQHVDHIVPLRSKIVSGLHCEANLRVVGAGENLTKGNRWWPDMPED